MGAGNILCRFEELGFQIFPCLFGGPLSMHSKGYCLYHSGFLMFLILELRFFGIKVLRRLEVCGY